MAATVEVNAKVIDNASPKLNEIDKLVESLNKKSVTIKVDTGSGSGTSGTSRATKEIKEISDVLREAGISAEEAGEKAKSVSTQVGEETKKVTETFKKGIGETVQASSDGTVKITHDYEAQRKAAEKTAAAEKNAAEKAAKAERDSANRRIATFGRIATAAAAAFVIKETKEALNTMKDVDSELANIQKVTGESEKSIAKLGDTAYKTASKYGVAATEYLSSAAEFAKAGYDNYAQLSELAIKTQLVGDVTADTASKFLLSADAAYKMGGNIDSLSAVLDRANVIENNYATSIYKIAEGLPIVASTASMANMSIDELMAGLGTITAVTQETGRKAATAMRALILNIEGEIGTVIDEDMTITQESVESMADALKKYGNEAVKAAQKTGKLVDPMEAIRSLAEAFKRGDLSDQALFDILSPLGGKLRTNQLTALVTNYDMFAEMLDKVKTSAGSADREMNILLETWNAKTNQLKNSWTELVSNVIDTDLIKNALDGVRSIIDSINELMDSRSDKEEATISEYERLYGENGTLAKERKNLEAHLDQLNDFDKRRLEYLKAQENTLTQQVSAAHKLTQEERLSYISQASSPMASGIYLKRSTSNLVGFNNLYSDAIAEDGSKNRQQIYQALQSALSEYEEYYSIIKSLQEENVRITDKDALKFAEIYEEALKAAEKAAEDAKEEIERLGENVDGSGKSLDDATKSLNNYAKAADEAAKAINAFAEATQTTKSGNADAYRTAYQQFLEDYTAGKTDSNVVKAAAEMFLPETIRQALGYNLQAMGELLASDLYQGIYNGASGNAGVDFVNYMAQNMTDALDAIVNITENADGTLNFEYASLEKLASYFNLPIGAIQALISSLDEFGVQANIGWEDAENLANALGLVGENAGQSGITLEGIARSLKEDFGYADEVEVSKIISALDAGGYLSAILGEITPEAIGAAVSAAFKEAEIDATPDNPPTPEDIIDTSQVEEAAEKIKDIPDKTDKKVNIHVTGLEDINSFKEWLNTSPEDYQVIVNDDGSITIVGGKASDLSDYLKGMGEGAYSVSVNDDGSIDVVKGQGTSLYGLLTDLDTGDFAVYVGDDGSVNAVMGDATGLDNFLTTMGEGDYAVTVDDDDTIHAVKLDAETAEATLKTLENPVTVKVGEDGSIETIEGTASALKDTLTAIDGLEGSTYTITISDPDNAEKYKTTLEGIKGTYDVTVKEDGSVQAKVKADALENVLSLIEGDTPVNVTADVDGTEDVKGLADQEDRVETKGVAIVAGTSGTEDTKELADEEARIDDKSVEIEAKADPGQISGFASIWHGLKSKNITINATVHYSSSGSRHGGSGGEFAEGTNYAPGGLSLVNELGPELISDNGRAYIANGGKPAIVNLGKGAIVLTAEETRQALGNATIYGGINAYAGGFNLEGNGYDPNIGRKASNGNSGTGATGITNTGTTTPQWQEYYIDPNESKKLAEQAQEAAEAAVESWEAIEKRLKDELGLINDTAEYYHNFKDHMGEARTYKEAIDKLSAAKQQLLDSGYDELSLEVVSLTNQIFEYGEKFTDATRHFYEDLNDRLSDVLSSLDELAQWYHNQGRHEEEIAVYEEKIAQLEAVKAELLANGYAETDEEVLKLSNQIFDIEKDIQDAKNHAYEEVVDNLNEILDGLNTLAEYYFNQGDFDKAVETQQQRVTEIQNAIDTLLANGYDELSTEVVSLLNQLFSTEEEIQDAREYEYTHMIDDLEELLNYLNKLADYYHTTGDVDKEIETLERARSEVEATKQKVLDLGYDELDEKVIDLAKSSYDYSEKIASAKAPSSSGGGSSKDDLSDILKKYDALANYYRNKKDYSSEEAAIQDALNELNKRRDKLLKQGYAETSEKVVELANKIFEYEEKVLEARKRSIDDLKDQLSNLDSQIDIAKYQADAQRMIALQREAQNKIAELIQKYREAGYSDTSDEILDLTKMGYGYAENESSEVKNLWKDLINALEDMRDTQDDANDLAEKQLAVDEARMALEKAQKQRNVRVFNPVTGQWEWVTNANDIQKAEEALSKAEESLLDKQTSQELALLKQAMENGGTLNGVSIGPGLSALLSGASVEQTNAFATALGALSGGLDLAADTSAKSIFDSVDSHDNVTQYQFNGVSIDTATAENTTLADLTRMITPLALTNNMPA